MYKNKKLWCYLNISNPIVAWEVAIGRISSIDSSPDIEEKYRRSFLSLWQYSKLKNSQKHSDWSYFEQEMRIDIIRHRDFPQKVSRLRGCYFFESKEMAINVVKYFNWKGFNKDFLSEIDFVYESENDISTYDSAWISDNMTDDEIRSYLNGDTKYESPASELICYGRGLVLNHLVISKADEIARKAFPKSTLLLDSAKFIFNDRFLGRFNATKVFDWDAYHAAQISPFLLTADKDNLKVEIIGSQNAYSRYGVLKTDDDIEVCQPDFTDYTFIIPKKVFFKSYRKLSII
ncbi:hypothetical protein PVK62_16770 [Aliivibrio sp. S3MY1]|uniref:hypothetical protein n=1 Tax=unclassified Aliivibrio TaxID=2645654 RepID=UPI00237A07E0|nr:MULTISPECIES: hypothetical protein [unclassified Aliivibrio]MDD9197480.1 hypothetical protein [Aliivibrio sp. S3MY1]MDD9200716.1 hypothetical protein [Aliivibrio sp. S2MY1]